MAIGRSGRPKAGTGIMLLDGMPSFLAAENLMQSLHLKPTSKDVQKSPAFAQAGIGLWV